MFILSCTGNSNKSSEPRQTPEANPLLIKGERSGEEEEGECRGRGGGMVPIGCYISINDTFNPINHQSGIRKKGKDREP